MFFLITELGIFVKPATRTLRMKQWLKNANAKTVSYFSLFRDIFLPLLFNISCVLNQFPLLLQTIQKKNEKSLYCVYFFWATSIRIWIFRFNSLLAFSSISPIYLSFIWQLMYCFIFLSTYNYTICRKVNDEIGLATNRASLYFYSILEPPLFPYCICLFELF